MVTSTLLLVLLLCAFSPTGVDSLAYPIPERPVSQCHVSGCPDSELSVSEHFESMPSEVEDHKSVSNISEFDTLLEEINDTLDSEGMQDFIKDYLDKHDFAEDCIDELFDSLEDLIDLDCITKKNNQLNLSSIKDDLMNCFTNFTNKMAKMNEGCPQCSYVKEICNDSEVHQCFLKAESPIKACMNEPQKRYYYSARHSLEIIFQFLCSEEGNSAYREMVDNSIEGEMCNLKLHTELMECLVDGSDEDFGFSPSLLKNEFNDPCEKNYAFADCFSEKSSACRHYNYTAANFLFQTLEYLLYFSTLCPEEIPEDLGDW